MNITTNPAPYVPSPGKLSRIEAMQELTRLASIPDLRAQDSDCLTEVPFGGLKTYWSRGLGEDVPPFLTHSVKGVKRFHILAADRQTVAVYDRPAPKNLERRALLEDPAEIAASLPQKALNPDVAPKAATDKQIGLLRKVLELPADYHLPVISSLAASRIIDRIMNEGTVALLADDIQAWVAQPRAVAA